jgi:L-fuculose-phosphate aldolase
MVKNMNPQIEEARKKICETGELLFNRFLTDAAGGNISMRVGDLICITPRYSGARFHWKLKPEQVLVVDAQGNVLDGDGTISREARVHLKLYQEFPVGNAVVHSHPRNVLVFCSAGMPIQPVIEATWKFGKINVVSYAPSHSKELAEQVAAGLRGQEDRVKVQAAAVIARWHGLFVLAKDLDAGFDATERIDTNARCILLSSLLQQGSLLAEERAHNLEADLSVFGKDL